VPPNYREFHAAEDVFKFMEALRLPPCHLVGLAVGASFALQMAIDYPHKVLSLFMISPLSSTEPEIIADGRQEIYDCWVAGQQDVENPDHDALHDAILGALELGFNRSQTSIVNALAQYTLPQGLRNWTPEKFRDFHRVSVGFFLDHEPYPIEVLKMVTCPVHLVHCGESIAYPLQCSEELKDRMEDAGLDVRLSHNPDATFFGTITHPEPINDLLHDWIMNNTDLFVPPAKEDVTSPFEAGLAEAGYVKDDDSDTDSDDLFVTVP
jgi:pimeloyl-ACP methyl ester carboxylesterase